MKTHIFILCIIFSFTFLKAQPEKGMNYESGKCYAKCYTPSRYQEVNEYNVFTGDAKKENVKLKTFYKIYQDYNSLKVLELKNEPSPIGLEPNIYWDTLKLKSNKVEFQYLLDTTQTTNFKKMKIVQTIEREGGGGFLEWREILCDTQVTSSLLEKVINALKAAGFYNGPAKNEITTEVRKSITNYQRANGLPIGALDFETLKKMGIYGNK